MSDQPWDKEREQKYRDHDLPLEDLKPRDIEAVRGAAITGFTRTPESDNVKLIISAFMGFLTSKGYRITKKDAP
jgi:hypothetical protein